MQNTISALVTTTGQNADPSVSVYSLDSTGSNINFTLYSSVTYNTRSVYLVRVDSFPGNTVTILPFGTEKIGGASSYSLVNGSNVQLLAQNGNWLVISNNNNTALANEGSGTGLIYDAGTSTAFVNNLRSLLVNATAGSEGITIATTGTTVTIGDVLTAANLTSGGDFGWFAQRSTGPTPQLQFRSLLAGTGITASSNATDITVSLTGGIIPSPGQYQIPTINVNTSGQITSAVSNFGSVIFVDKTNGNDAKGAVNGPPFLTIGAALAVATSGQLVYVMPGAYTQTTALTVPAGVSLIGMSVARVSLTTTASAPLDMITVNNNSGLQQISLVLNVSGNNQARGIVLGDGTSGNASVTSTAYINNVNLTVNGTGTNPTATIGIVNNQPAGGSPVLPAVNGYACIKNCNITVNNTGTGPTIGVLCSTTNTSILNIGPGTTILAANSNGAQVGGVFGAQTNDASQTLTFQGTSLSATSTGGGGAVADISQSAGTLWVSSSPLVHSTANGKGFSTLVTPSKIVLGSASTPPAGTTSYFYPGNNTPSTSLIQTRIPVQCVCRSLSIIAGVNPGTRTDVFTVLNGGSSTAVTKTLPSGGTSVNTDSDNISATFNAGSLVAVSDLAGAGAGPVNVEVTLEFY